MKKLFYSLITITFLTTSINAQIDTTKRNEIRVSIFSVENLKPQLGLVASHNNLNSSSMSVTYLSQLPTKPLWFKIQVGGFTKTPFYYYAEEGTVNYKRANHWYFNSFIGVESQKNFGQISVFPAFGIYTATSKYAADFSNFNPEYFNFIEILRQRGAKIQLSLSWHLGNSFYFFASTNANLSYTTDLVSHDLINKGFLKTEGLKFNYILLDGLGITRRF